MSTFCNLSKCFGYFLFYLSCFKKKNKFILVYKNMDMLDNSLPKLLHLINQ